MSRWRRHASHLLRVQRILCRGSRGAIMCRTAMARFKMYQHYKPRRRDVFDSGTHKAAQGLVRRGCFGLLSISHMESSAREPLTLLGVFAPGLVGAALFLLPTAGGESLSSSSSSSSSADEEEVSLPDVMSGVLLRRGPFLAPWAAFLAVFSGTS